jgi:radical SAM protein with 4Fe4S-binding SPASM domain
MISVTKLYCSRLAPDSPTGYRADPEAARQRFDSPVAGVPSCAVPVKPALTWNLTRTCNLNCSHCYSDAEPSQCPDELSTREARSLIEDLGRFGVPTLLLRGGEPLMRADLLELIAYAHGQGIRTVLLTNGTLITAPVAARLKRSGIDYVSISLETLHSAHDCLRGKPGAFGASVAGLRNCAEAGQRAGIRVTLRKKNYRDLNEIFDFIEREEITRACFHHLVYAGRGNDAHADDLSHLETRQAMDLILRRAEDFHRRGLNIEILTDDNSVDGVYLYLKASQSDPLRAEQIYNALSQDGNGTCASGVGTGNIDAQGNIHPDQFWSHYTLGNIRQRPFSEIWADTSDPLLRGLRNCLPLLKGRCAKCLWKPLCRGNMRVRAERVYGDPWMPDPACYLSNEEVSREIPQPTDTMEDNVLVEEEAA